MATELAGPCGSDSGNVLGVWVPVVERMPPPDTWLLVAWHGGRVDKAHTFNKWKHHSHPLGYLIQGHPGAHVDVTHWMLLPQAPNAGAEPREASASGNLLYDTRKNT